MDEQQVEAGTDIYYEELRYVPDAAIRAFEKWLQRLAVEATTSAGLASQNMVNPLYLETMIAHGAEARALTRIAGDVAQLLQIRQEEEMERAAEKVAKPERINYGQE